MLFQAHTGHLWLCLFMKLISLAVKRNITKIYIYACNILRKFSWKEKYPIFVSLSKIVTFLECQFVMILKSHNIAEKALVYLHIPIYFRGKVVAQELLGSLWCRSLMHYKDDDDDLAWWHGMKEWHGTRPAKPKGSIHSCHIIYWGFNYNNNMPITFVKWTLRLGWRCARLSSSL